jgi:tRNA (cytidine/uridine-2'-O-)-methyltransferase
MFHIVLVEPEIPPNTGNVIRLAANTGAQLHLVRPLGFELSDKQLRRAGLDYHEYAERSDRQRMFALTTRGAQPFADVAFRPGDWLVFGCETRGLSDAQRQWFPPPQRVRLPMRPGNRSLNLSNAVAVVVFEAWRQNGYVGGG